MSAVSGVKRGDLGSLMLLLLVIGALGRIVGSFDTIASLGSLPARARFGEEYNVWNTHLMPEFTTQNLQIPSLGARAAVYHRFDIQKPNLEADYIARVLVFGGIDQEVAWTYTPIDNIWFPLPLKLQPAPRLGHTLTTFCGSYVVLFGGISIEGLEEFFTSYSYDIFEELGDTWIFDGINEMWRELSIREGPSSPRSRAFHSAVSLRNSDSACHCKESVFLYGGRTYDGSGLLDDLWELNCHSLSGRNLSFEWSNVARQPNSHWPFASDGHLAMQVDVAKTAMMIWPIKHVTVNSSEERYWVFDSTSRAWHSFIVDRDLNRDYTAMYHTAVFHVQMGCIVELVLQSAYTFSMPQRQWVATNATLEESVVKKGMTMAAAYVDSIILVFSSSDPEEFRDRPRVWMLQFSTLPLVWKLNTYKPEPPVMTLIGSWSNVGNFIILCPRQAHNLELLMMEIWEAYRANVRGTPDVSWNEKHQFLRQTNMGILMAIGVLQLRKAVPVPSMQINEVHDQSHVVWQLDMLTLRWFPYSTLHSTSKASRFYSVCTNWAKKGLVTFGSSLTNETDVETIPILRSDVWVYFTDNRRWINVTTVPGTNPGFLLFPSMTHYGENSFLVFGGATVSVSRRMLDKFLYYRYLKCIDCEFNEGNFSSALDVMSPNNDLWLLTLTDCNSISCFYDGIVGIWKQLLPRNARGTKLPSRRVGHSSHLIDGKLFVFGGVGFNEAAEMRRVFYETDVWYYNTITGSWFVAKGNGLKQFPFSSFKFHTGVFRTCAIGKRVLSSFPKYSFEEEQAKVSFRLLSYFTDTGQWVDQQLDVPFQEEAFFCWQHRVVITTRQSQTYLVDYSKFRDKTKVYMSELQPGCLAGQHSLNWSVRLCMNCEKGYFSSAGATLCTRCPGGLSTDGTGASSISNCSCDPMYCLNGRCSIVQSETQLAAECKCDLGYSGERCEFPILFIAVFSGVAAVTVVIALSVFLRKVVNYRKAKQTKETELEEMNRVWTISSSEVALLYSVDTTSPGSYGDVFKARYRDIDVAVKKLKVVMRNHRVEREFRREIQLMKSIRHPNIVLFIGAGMDDENNCPFLILEFMQGGTLTNVLRDMDVRISSAQQIRFCLDAAKGLQFLHNLSPPRVHRDIKSNNLLLSESWVVKVADFGCARLVKHEGLEQRVAQREMRTPFDTLSSHASTPLLQATSDLSSNVGAVLWRAPEVFSRESYGTRVDVYSFGIVMWEVNARELPYLDMNYQFIEDVRKAVVSGKRPTIPQDMPQDYRSLMTSCWSGNALVRPSFDEIVERLETIHRVTAAE